MNIRPGSARQAHRGAGVRQLVVSFIALLLVAVALMPLSSGDNASAVSSVISTAVPVGQPGSHGITYGDAYSIEKTADKYTVARGGEEVTYTYRIRNTSSMRLCTTTRLWTTNVGVWSKTTGTPCTKVVTTTTSQQVM